MAERRFDTITGADWAWMFQRHRNQKMNTYRFRYFILADKEAKEHILDIDRANPISALDAFHRLIQKSIKPDGYQLKTCALWYNDDPWGQGRGQMRESIFDLPKTPNPDVAAFNKPAPLPAETQTMPFYDEIASTKPPS